MPHERPMTNWQASSAPTIDGEEIFGESLIDSPTVLVDGQTGATRRTVFSDYSVFDHPHSAANPCIQDEKEHAMKLSSAQIAQTLDKFEADVVPENNPVMPQLTRLFGEHTYFLDQA